MSRRSESWASDELIVILARLTSQQAGGVLRIVEAEIEGRSLSSLLDCPGQICSSNTFYGAGKRKGWRQKPDFVRALGLARRDYRAWMMTEGVQDALTILAGSAPDAARALHREVAGDWSAIESLARVLENEDAGLRAAAAQHLGETGLPDVVPILAARLAVETDLQVKQALVLALGRVATWRDGERRSAATAVLDRVDIRTAAKKTVSSDDIDEAIRDELARLAGHGESANAGQTAGDPDADGGAAQPGGAPESDPGG